MVIPMKILLIKLSRILLQVPEWVLGRLHKRITSQMSVGNGDDQEKNTFYETKTHINVFICFFFFVCLVNCPTALAGNSDVYHYLLFMGDSECTRLNLPSRLLLQKTDIMVSAMLHAPSLFCILCFMRTTLLSRVVSREKSNDALTCCIMHVLARTWCTMFTSCSKTYVGLIFVCLLCFIVSIVGIYVPIHYSVWNTLIGNWN